MTITMINNYMGLPINEDTNRVEIGNNLVSKFSKENKELNLKEEFIGGFKTLSNDPFFKSVTHTNIKDVENGLMNNPNTFFHSEGEVTGIKHIAYFDVMRGCFLVWRLIPNHLVNFNNYLEVPN